MGANDAVNLLQPVGQAPLKSVGKGGLPDCVQPTLFLRSWCVGVRNITLKVRESRCAVAAPWCRQLHCAVVLGDNRRTRGRSLCGTTGK